MQDYDFGRAKLKYRELCKTEPSINIYMQDWYLDAVTDENADWKVVIYEEDDVIYAAFPFQYAKRHGLYYITNPWQCARAGVWIRPKVYKSKLDELLHHKKIVDELLQKLPYYDVFRISFHSGFVNWQPFYWQGFSEQIYYSMIIKSEEKEYLPFISKKRRERINRVKRAIMNPLIGEPLMTSKCEKTKASTMGGGYLVNTEILSLDEYWSFLEKSYKSKQKELSYSKKQFSALFKELIIHDACNMYSVVNSIGEIVAANIIFKDGVRCYNQFGSQIQGIDGDCQSFIAYKAINDALESSRIFDFEGSMIPGVCEFNASYNPVWEPYHVIYKYSKRYQALDAVRKLSKGFIG